MENKFIQLGHIAKTHGLKGEITIELENELESVLDIGIEVKIADQMYEIEHINFANKIICKLKDINSIDEAQKLVGETIEVNRELFPELPEGEFYLCDMIGMDVQDETGRVVGRIESIYNNGAGEVVVIKQNRMDVDIPLVSNFFPLIDIPNKKIVVNLPDYL